MRPRTASWKAYCRIWGKDGSPVSWGQGVGLFFGAPGTRDMPSYREASCCRLERETSLRPRQLLRPQRPGVYSVSQDELKDSEAADSSVFVPL